VASLSDEIAAVYERHADFWDRRRGSRLVIEKGWIDRFITLLPAGGSVLDVGCGSGQPIARCLIERGFDVVGVDSSPALISKCRARFPDRQWLVADMRTMAIGRRFDGLVVWDSFFHLNHEDQRAMFPVFREHAADGAALLLTTGTEHGEAIGSFQEEPLYHASLSAQEYRDLFEAHDFDVLAHVVEDPTCGRHTVWLARLKARGSEE
jgi:SAM-dependent methyltransferase